MATKKVEMITDQQTNQLFLADSLPIKQAEFFYRFEKVLKECQIDFQLLPNTNDIWAVDYMPIQVNKDKFVQFTYTPDYLKPKKYRKTISDVDSICKEINIKTIKSSLIVDGGNVIKAVDKVIMCDKVFRENRNLTEKALIKELKNLFEVDKLIFVPWDLNDFTGHADGMVRFIDSNTVLINDYEEEEERFQLSFRMSLQNASLDWIELPYRPQLDAPADSARGNYMNYLEMEQAIIVPIFNLESDIDALKVLQQVFKGRTIKTIECNNLADEGGILNCISWNILA